MGQEELFSWGLRSVRIESISCWGVGYSPWIDNIISIWCRGGIQDLISFWQD